MRSYFFRSFLSLLVLLGAGNRAWSQSNFIKLATPSREKNTVSSTRFYITGSTAKDARVTINDTAVYVWPTGAFVYQLDLRPGSDTSFLIKSVDAKGKKIEKTVFYSYKVPEKEKTLDRFAVEYLRVQPDGDQLLQEGDHLMFTIKSLPGCKVTMENGFVLDEVIVTDSNAIQGIYKGEYIVKKNDDYLRDRKNLKFFVKAPDEQELFVTTKNFYALMPDKPLLLQTKGKLPFLLEGLGEDRLGGTKIGYLDSLVKLNAIGKVGNRYKVRLSKNHTAYIEEQLVDVLNNGSFSSSSLTNTIRVWGDSAYDYVSVILNDRLPYRTYQEINPSRIVVDIYGATSNTNWITQMQSAREISNVYYRQTEDDVFSITIDLEHQQHWGHSIYYEGNRLIVRVKRQPVSLELKNLVIGVDAGHGGTNTGASGALGIYEKEFTLLIAQQLKVALEKEGAKVIMTRTKDTTYDNLDRILLYREVKPDLVVSIHLNSSADPIRVQGVSTYYKYIGFRPLTRFVLKRMLELGLKEYGNVGNFNFMLNSPIEYPNVLVETLFVSHPEDEMNVMNENYRKQMADKIVLGIKDWLKSCKD